MPLYSSLYCTLSAHFERLCARGSRDLRSRCWDTAAAEVYNITIPIDPNDIVSAKLISNVNSSNGCAFCLVRLRSGDRIYSRPFWIFWRIFRCHQSFTLSFYSRFLLGCLYAACIWTDWSKLVTMHVTLHSQVLTVHQSGSCLLGFPSAVFDPSRSYWINRKQWFNRWSVALQCARSRDRFLAL